MREPATACGRRSVSWAQLSCELSLVQVHRACQSLLMCVVQETCKTWIGTDIASTLLFQCHCPCFAKGQKISGQEPVTYLETK